MSREEKSMKPENLNTNEFPTSLVKGRGEYTVDDYYAMPADRRVEHEQVRIL